jgi:hypothetical protein
VLAHNVIQAIEARSWAIQAKAAARDAERAEVQADVGRAKAAARSVA